MRSKTPRIMSNIFMPPNIIKSMKAFTFVV